MTFFGFAPDDPQPAKHTTSNSGRDRVMESPGSKSVAKEDRTLFNGVLSLCGSPALMSGAAAWRKESESGGQLAPGGCHERPHRGHGDGVADQDDMAVAEKGQGAAGVEAESLIVRAAVVRRPRASGCSAKRGGEVVDRLATVAGGGGSRGAFIALGDAVLHQG